MKQVLSNRRFARATLAVLGAAALIAVGITGVTGVHAGRDGQGAYLGVYMQELTRDVRRGLDLDVRDGVLISGVADDSPAARAGVEDGDVIVEFNGKAVSDPDELSDLVSQLDPGKKVKIVVVRDGKRKTIKLKVGEKPEDFGTFSTRHMKRFAPMMKEFSRNAFFFGQPRIGVRAAELNEDLASYFDAPDDSGVLVLDVVEDSMAEEAGVKAGDVILQVGDEKIDEISDIGDALEDLDEGDTVDLTVLRHGKKKTLKATVTDTDEQYSFNFTAPKMHWRGRPPRVMVDRLHEDGGMDELRGQLDELRRELKKLRKEIREKR